MLVTVPAMASLETGTYTVSVGYGYPNGNLVIDSVGSNGAVTGTIYSNPIVGVWDESAQKLTFVREINLCKDPASVQMYTGYRFIDSASKRVTLAGIFEALEGPHTVYGWYATRT